MTQALMEAADKARQNGIVPQDPEQVTWLVTEFETHDVHLCPDFSGLISFRQTRLEFDVPDRFRANGGAIVEEDGLIWFGLPNCRTNARFTQEILVNGSWQSQQIQRPGIPVYYSLPRPPNDPSHLGFKQGVGNDLQIQRFIFGDGQGECIRATGLFKVSPNSMTLLFHDRRTELGFKIEERIDPSSNQKVIIFSTPTCRLTMKVEREIKDGASWHPVLTLR